MPVLKYSIIIVFSKGLEINWIFDKKPLDSKELVTKWVLHYKSLILKNRRTDTDTRMKIVSIFN